MSVFTLLLLFFFFLYSHTSSASDPPGFLSLSCGSRTAFTDSSNIHWLPDAPYVSSGNATSSPPPQVSLRFFPKTHHHPRRNCYRIPATNVSLLLIRPRFVYNNYDGMGQPPAFTVSLGRAHAAAVNLSVSDPWEEEFVWRVDRDTLVFCLHAVDGFPVISSLELRPLPAGAYRANPLLRKRFRINCGYVDGGAVRYPIDQYDRIWDADRNFSPSRLSAGFRIPTAIDVSGVRESPPVSVLQTARVLARKNVLNYSFPLDRPGDFYGVLYFAGIMPVSSSFDVLVNNDVVRSNFSVKQGEATSIFFSRKKVRSLNIAFRNISFFPQVNGIEIYEIVEMPQECSSTTVAALQVISQSTGFDLGWQDDPCSPMPWEHLKCEGSHVTSLKLSNVELRAIGPTFGDLLDLRTLDLDNASLAGEVMNLGTLQQLEILNLSFNKLTSFGSDFGSMLSLQILDLQNNSLEGIIPEILGDLKDLHLLNLENNKLQGVLPQSLNKERLEVRTSGNLCLAFSPLECSNSSDHPSIQTPQVTVVNMRNPSGHNHKAVIICAVGGVCCALLLVTIVMFLYRRKNKRNMASKTWTARELRSWNAARVFTYKEIKAATNNFKDVIGSGGFGSIYLVLIRPIFGPTK